MSLLALLLAVQAVPPYVAFPEAGLDDPAAYEGYATRLYRDARGNAVQIYLDRKNGRVVHLWADALNESMGFTARDTAGGPSAVGWGAPAATIGNMPGGRRRLTYSLAVPGGRSVRIGHFLLGSMRIERDFQYAGRHHDSLGAPAFVPDELAELLAHLARLPRPERRRHLAVLGVSGLAALRARLEPRLTVEQTATTWVVRVEQASFDGKHHLSLALSGDTRRATLH
ncbi:MAG: hypothetical protein ACREMC_08070, partial [Gemmatimonadales bacterium]